MEIIPKSYKEYAKALFLIAKKDYERAIIMFNNKDYPACIFFCQQCVEKCVNSMLETKLFFVKEHNVLPYFVEKFREEWKEDYNIIVEALEFLMYEWSRTRYPFNIDRVYLPEEYYTEEKARKALDYAKRVLEITEEYLKDKNVL